MKTYIVFDKETGQIVHKYRKIVVDQADTEDTVECDDAEVLSSYRGTLPHERLGVAQVSDYAPLSSRRRTSRYDVRSKKIVHTERGDEPGNRRTTAAKQRPPLTGGRE